MKTTYWVGNDKIFEFDGYLYSQKGDKIMIDHLHYLVESTYLSPSNNHFLVNLKTPY